jgi:hypothetical protein
MTARERRLVARLVREAVQPSAPLPPVERTDAVEAFDAWLGHAPRPHRLVLRGLIVASALAPRRLGSVRSVLRRLAAQAYYGDPAVMRQLGYDAAEVVRRAAAVRAAEGRP